MLSSNNRTYACNIVPAIRMLYSRDGMAVCSFIPYGDDPQSGHSSRDPDNPLITEPDSDIALEFENYTSLNGRKPETIIVRGIGRFYINGIKKSGRLAGKIVIITGGAQGLGNGLASALAAEGAYIAIADLNLEGALVCARELNEKYGEDTAIAVRVDVSDEDSVRRMVQETVLSFGGLDVLVSNAGVLIAGPLGQLSKESFDLVTKVNYTGYFLCAKYAAEPMKIQRKYAPDHLMDIIEINSKSGLDGSNKNSAYTGSKFGGIGLTQSFAKELVEYGIKVNAVCPGNLLESPLWTDPENGLFKQYLDSGKVKGAKTTEDVKIFYEAGVPMGRGCTVKDIVRAVLYVIEQEYETGQAIPVTGGQIMLR